MISSTLKHVLTVALSVSLLTAIGLSCAPAPVRQSEAVPSQGAAKPHVEVSPYSQTSPGQPDQVRDASGQGQGTTGEQLPQPSISNNAASTDDEVLPLTSMDQLHTTGYPPAVDISTYRLTVDGFVDHPLSLTYSDLKAIPSIEKTVSLVCPGLFIDNARWKGIPVAQLLSLSGIQARANKVTFVSIDGYRQMLTMDEAQAEGVFLAYAVNGQELPASQGFPLRLVAKGKVGNIWVKWVERLEIG